MTGISSEDISPQSDAQLQYKREAAQAAVKYIEDGMAVGLGSGTTASVMIDALAARVKNENLRVRAIPTSEVSGEQARRLGITLSDFVQDPILDIAIDGADEVHRESLTLIKGRGGALLREKIVASAARKFIVIVDDRKIVDSLGSRMPLPIEVIPWGWERIQTLLISKIGARTAHPRTEKDGRIYQTDNHNFILDCVFDPITDAASLARDIAAITGVVDHGLFIDMTSEVLVAGQNGVASLRR